MKSSIIAKSSIQLDSDRCAEMSRLYISMNLTKSRIQNLVIEVGADGSYPSQVST